MATTFQFGYVEARLVVFREEFTGTGAQTTFQLTGAVGNATFNTGTWGLVHVERTMACHTSDTDGSILYDGINPLTRHVITVSSISAGGLVTLAYPPQNGDTFYIWYWYDMDAEDDLINYYRDDFVTSMEAAAGVSPASGVPTDTTNFGGLLNSTDNTIQKALDSLDDLAVTSDYGVVGTVTHSGVKINTPQDLQATAGPSFDHLHLTVAIGTAPLVVTSTTMVGNLNAELVGGLNGSDIFTLAAIMGTL